MSPNKKVKILAKLEGQNLGGSASIKDRVAKYMLQKAEQRGELTRDKVIIEATSGNTGIALAWLGHKQSYRVTIVMPDNINLYILCHWGLAYPSGDESLTGRRKMKTW